MIKKIMDANLEEENKCLRLQIRKDAEIKKNLRKEIRYKNGFIQSLQRANDSSHKNKQLGKEK